MPLRPCPFTDWWMLPKERTDRRRQRCSTTQRDPDRDGAGRARRALHLPPSLLPSLSVSQAPPLAVTNSARSWSKSSAKGLAKNRPSTAPPGVLVDLSLTTGDVSVRAATIWDAQLYVTGSGRCAPRSRSSSAPGPPDIVIPQRRFALGQQKGHGLRSPRLEAALTNKSSYVPSSAAYALG